MLTPIADLIATIRPRLRTLSAAEALRECHRHPRHLRIDVREPEEVAQQPIPGSVNIPRGVLEMRLSSQHPEVDLPIYLHCATGARASLAAEQLRRIGYRNVSVIGCPLATLSELCGSAGENG